MGDGVAVSVGIGVAVDASVFVRVNVAVGDDVVVGIEVAVACGISVSVNVGVTGVSSDTTVAGAQADRKTNIPAGSNRYIKFKRLFIIRLVRKTISPVYRW